MKRKIKEQLLNLLKYKKLKKKMKSFLREKKALINI